MYCGGERRWRREIFKEKCMIGRWKRRRRKKKKWRRPFSSHLTRHSDGIVGIKLGGGGGGREEEEEEEEGGIGK